MTAASIWPAVAALGVAAMPALLFWATGFGPRLHVSDDPGSERKLITVCWHMRGAHHIVAEFRA